MVVLKKHIAKWTCFLKINKKKEFLVVETKLNQTLLTLMTSSHIIMKISAYKFNTKKFQGNLRTSGF